MKFENRYYLLRHGTALSNTKNIISSWPEKKRFGLVKKGRDEIKIAARVLKEKNIDLVFSSDLLRTKQTAEIVSNFLNVKIIFDKRLREYDFGAYNCKSLEEFLKVFKSQKKRFVKKPEGGETYAEIKKRARDFLISLEEKYSGKNILIISHQVPLIMLEGVIKKFSNKIILNDYLLKNKIRNGEVRIP